MVGRSHAGIGLTVLLIIGIAGALTTGFIPGLIGDSSDLSEQSTIEISTGVDPGASPEYGLLNQRWEQAYNGTSRWNQYDYDFTGDGNQTREQCANCHMDTNRYEGTAGREWDKHSPPLHPITIELKQPDTGGEFSNSVNGSSGWSGQWFYDDDNHRGPNTRLAAGYAGIRPNGNQIECGACHTAKDPSTAYGPEITSTDQYTNDPHSVHRDVLAREGCIRCHNYGNISFYRDDPATSGFQQDTLVFVQGNATRKTFGIANPINMTRVWDYRVQIDDVDGIVMLSFLSTTEEANYSYDAGGTGLTTSGNGWAVYGSAETSRTSEYSCTDCHDQYHAKQGFADTGGYGMEFAFNDSPGSRKGPYAPVNDSESFGVRAGGRNITCGVCHPTDTHAVHTNGGMVSTGTLSQVEASTDQTILGGEASQPYTFDDSILGAELCDECHSQNVGGKNTAHFQYVAARGLGGDHRKWYSSHNRYPDLEAASQEGGNQEDCGFCHRIGNYEDYGN